VAATERNEPDLTDGRPKPATQRPAGTEIEELNRQTQPKAPTGQVVDPKQERDPDTAG